LKEESALSVLEPAASSPQNFFDLTMLSSDDNQFVSSNNNPVIDLVTPVKKRVNIILRNRNSPLRNHGFGSSPINLIDSDEDVIPDPASMPPLDNPAAVSKYSFVAWARLFDSERLLIKVIYNMDEAYRSPLLGLLSNLSKDELWGHMDLVMTAYSTDVSSERSSLRGIDSSTLEYLKTSIKLFEM
jgi:hypothetical protein